MIPTTERGLKALTWASLKLYQKGLIKVMPLCALYFLILFVLQFTHEGLRTSVTNEALRISCNIVIALLSFVVQPFIFSAMLFTLHHQVIDEAPHYKVALAYTLRCFPRMILAYLCFMVLMILGFALFIAPGFLVILFLIFFFMFIVLEENRVIQSLKNSAKLVSVAWGKTLVFLAITFFFFCLFGGLGLLVVIEIAGGLSFLASFLSNHPDLMILTRSFVGVMATLIPALLLPMVASFFLQQYYDLRVRQKHHAIHNVET